MEDAQHDPAQHTEAAERQRFRRVVKAVDKILDEDDTNYDGYGSGRGGGIEFLVNVFDFSSAHFLDEVILANCFFGTSHFKTRHV